MNLADNAILVAVKNLPGGTYGAYTALKVAFPATPFFSVCYKLLSPKSKEKLKTVVKGDDLLGKFYTKYLILTLLLESETMSIQDVLSNYGDTAKEYLSMIGIDASPETLQTKLDENVDKIIELIKTYKDPNALFKYVPMPSLPSIPFMGGKRTKRKRRTRRRGGGDNLMSNLAYEGINRGNFNYWHRKDPITYKDYNAQFYYPSAINAYNPLNARFRGTDIKPELWVNRVKRHCGEKSKKNIQDFRLCVSRKCAPGDGEHVYGSSCNLNTYKD